jgi:hypothetical protein
VCEISSRFAGDDWAPAAGIGISDETAKVRTVRNGTNGVRWSSIFNPLLATVVRLKAYRIRAGQAGDAAIPGTASWETQNASSVEET